MTARITLMMLVLGLLPGSAIAQPFASTGTRAAGMGGAFTGVADDASAIYWNPAALAAGAIVSAVVDFGNAQAAPDGLDAAEERSSFLFALTMPALGLGYYRLRSTSVEPGIRLTGQDALAGTGLSALPALRTDSLITHHAGVTLVQSITQGIAVGSTLKFVRGVAASREVFSSDRDAVLSAAADLIGRASNRFDLDLGVVAYGGPLKVGLTVRNLREPGFPVAGEEDRDLTLERQARAGVSYALGRRWLASADLDLTRSHDPFGERRDLAVGAEGQLSDRLWIRTGASLNTLEDERFGGGRRARVSGGASYAARAGLLVDGHFSIGDERSGHTWGLAARFVY